MEAASPQMEDSISLGSSWEVASDHTLGSEGWEVVSDVEELLPTNAIVIEGDRSVISAGSDIGRQWRDVVQKDTERMASQLMQANDASEEETVDDETLASPTRQQDEDDEWMIETIAHRKRQHGEVHYRVLWKSYGYTWETEEWLEENGFGDWVDAYESGALKSKHAPEKHREQTTVLVNKESGVQLPALMQLNPYFCPENVWPDFGSRITACANVVHKQVLMIRNIISNQAARKFANVARKSDMEKYVLVMLYAQLPANFAGSMKEKLTFAMKNLKLSLLSADSIREVVVFAGIMERESLSVISVLPCFAVSVADMKYTHQSTAPHYVGAHPRVHKASSTSTKSGKHPAVPEPGCDDTQGAWLHRGTLREALAKRHSDKDVRALPVWLKKFQKEGLLKGRRVDRSRDTVNHRSSHQPRSVAVH